VTNEHFPSYSSAPLSAVLLQLVAVESGVATGASAREQRQRLADTIEALMATLARLAMAAPESLQRQTFPALSQLLQRMHTWAASDIGDDEQAAKQLLADLQVMIGIDPGAAEARRQAESDASVDQSLGEIFGKLELKL
jgi:hypothetical protein